MSAKRDWKPGDVARFDVDDLWVTAIRDRNGDWHGVGGGSAYTYNGWDGHPSRPLVVIDPEDREQVEQLIEGLLANGWKTDLSHGGDVRAALRSLIEPPKPAEPQGLGAVVEDADGHLWVRYANQALAYMHWRHETPAHACRLAKWSGINAVKVLSEGVQS